MSSLNKVMLIGNLGADPEIRSMPSGDAVANLSLATTDRYRDKATGENKETTEWHRVVFFGRLAEVVRDYLKKGSSVYVEGRIRTRKWQDQSGQNRYSTEIIADQMKMLGKNEASNPQPNQQSQYQSHQRNNYQDAKDGRYQAPRTQAAAAAGFDQIDDDIPF